MIPLATRPTSPRPSARRGAVVTLVLLLLSGCSMANPRVPPPEPAPTSATGPPHAGAAPGRTAAPAQAASPMGRPPASVTVDAIALSEPLIGLGLQPDGSMEVPTDFDDVGWFTGGGRPGSIGPTVIAGHVDSADGSAVFARLTELAVGDTVLVTNDAGAVFDYVVTRVGDYSKTAFPTAEVFGATATDELRLITCTGLFDRTIGHYEDNRVVFASRS
jgi:LPXTG-site transpeptidase (sortase) family protein